MRIAAYKAAVLAGNCNLDEEPANTEENAVTAIVVAQRANGDSIDPAGARRLIRALVAVGLLKFD